MALPPCRPVRGGCPLTTLPAWLWIPLTVAAAILLALRTAAQKWLAGRLSTDAATYVRYLFAWPLVIVYAAAASLGLGLALPAPNAASLGWAASVAAGQIGGTRFLLKALESRNFAVGVAYSKTDVIQAALFEAAIMGAAITWGAAAAMALATLGVILISLKAAGRGIAVVWEGLGEPSALYGLLSGSCFAVAGVSVRGAVLELSAAGPLAASIVSLLSVLTIQVAVMGGYLLVREPGAFRAIVRSWRVSGFAGACGALSSICWFLALGLQKVAYVRTLGLVEILATIMLSRFLFKEKSAAREGVGICLLLAGIALLLNAG